MNVQLLCDELAVPVCVYRNMNVIVPPHPTPHPSPHPTHPKTLKGNCVADEGEIVSQVPERHRHLQDCVADEGKMVLQMRENQGCFGVTDEGDLVSQMRGLPFKTDIIIPVTSWLYPTCCWLNPT